MTKKTIYILVIGLVIRLVLMPYTSWPADTYHWYQTAITVITGFDLYDLYGYSYPPLWAYIFIPIAKAITMFFGLSSLGQSIGDMAIQSAYSPLIPPTITSPIFNFGYKLPLIIADITAGLMIRRIVQPLAPHRTDLAFALWFLNPLVIFVSGIHGQFDVIVVPFILLALILTNEKRYALSGVALTIATLFKLYPLFLFPLYLTLILKQSTTGKQKVISSAHFAVASLVTAILLTLPYLSSSNIWTAMFRRGDTLSLQGGFNVWFAAQSIKIEHWLTGTNASILVKIVPLAALAMIIMIPIAIMRQKLNLKTIIAGHLAIMIILFCYYSSLANPQYFLSVIAFLVIYVAVYNKYSLSLWIISIFGIAQYLLLATFAWKILLYPLAAYTPLLDVDDINRQLIGTPAQWIYWRNHPLVNPYIYSSGIGFFATTSVLIGCLKTISRQRSNNNHTSNHD